MMDESFIEAIASLEREKNQTVKIGERTYSPRPLTLIDEDPREEPISTGTLKSIVDYITSGIDGINAGDMMIHIEGPQRVSLISKVSGFQRKRTMYIRASALVPNFRFENWMDPESFIISLQSLFAPGGDKEKVLSIFGNIKSEAVQNHADNGITQKVTIRSGVAVRENAIVPNPVQLAPFRSFPEIEQPLSPFVLRVKDSGKDQPPGCALFPADGGLWQTEAIKRIAAWFAGQLGTGIKIIA